MEALDASAIAAIGPQHVVAGLVGLLTLACLVIKYQTRNAAPGEFNSIFGFTDRTRGYDKHNWMNEQMRKHGELYTIKLGPVPVVTVINEPTEARRLLGPIPGSAGGHAKDMGPYNEIFGTCMVAGNNETWANRKKQIKHLLTLGSAQDTIPHFMKYGDVLVDNMDKCAAAGKTCDVQDEVLRYGFDQAADSMWGLNSKVMQREKDWDECFHLLENMLADFFTMWVASIPLMFMGSTAIRVLRYLPSFVAPEVARFHREQKRLFEIGEMKMAERVKELRSKGLNSEDNVLSNFLKIKSPETGKDFTVRELVSDFWDLQNGGYDTTSHAMAFTLMNLALHPEWQEKVYQEAHKCLKGKKYPTWDDMKGLVLLDACIKESMRMYSPSGGASARILSKEEKVGKYTIPKGQIVIFSVNSMHYNEKYFPEPEKFKPERFMDPAKMEEIGVTSMPSVLGPFRPEKGSPGPWMSFIYGPRACLGQTLALVHLKLILSTIVNRYHMEPEGVPKPVMCFQLHCRDGIKMKLTRREPTAA